MIQALIGDELSGEIAMSAANDGKDDAPPRFPWDDVAAYFKKINDAREVLRWLHQSIAESGHAMTDDWMGALKEYEALMDASGWRLVATLSSWHVRVSATQP